MPGLTPVLAPHLLVLQGGDDDVHGALGQVLGPGHNLAAGQAIQPQLSLQRVGIVGQLGQVDLQVREREIINS